jgi:hypothetical protein
MSRRGPIDCKMVKCHGLTDGCQVGSIVIHHVTSANPAIPASTPITLDIRLSSSVGVQRGAAYVKMSFYSCNRIAKLLYSTLYHV